MLYKFQVFRLSNSYYTFDRYKSLRDKDYEIDINYKGINSREFDSYEIFVNGWLDKFIY